MKKTIFEFEGSKEIRTYYDLNHGADVLILIAEEFPKGSYYTIMSSILLRAFTFEAYLNHLGLKSFKFWEEVDSIRVMDKYKLLCKHLNLSPDYSKQPYKTLTELFRFRNALAHGKSVLLKTTKVFHSAVDPYDHIPKAKWQEYCNLENAKRAKKDIETIIKELHGAAGLGEYPFTDGIGIGGITVKNAQQRNRGDRE
jgi:hypothetical protein